MARILYTPIFYLRKDKRTKDGECPVYVRFQRINGKEPKFPLGLNVPETEWNEDTRRPTELALKIVIDKIETKINQQLLNAAAQGIKITPQLFKEFVKGKEKTSVRTFYDYFDDYVQTKFKRGKLRESTVAGYKVTRNALKEYRAEIKLKDINTKFLEGFENFLIKRAKEKGKDYVKGSRSNRIKHINAVLNYIERQGLEVENPYKKGDLEVPQARKNDVFLDFDDLRKLVELMYTLEAGTKEYRVLCMFLFSCVTGLRFNDTLDLKWDNIDFDSVDGYTFLSIDTRKTGAAVDMPIFQIGEEMLVLSAENSMDNVKHENYIFYRYKGNSTNITLRKLAQMVGIEKHISHNCSRRTFITLLKAQGLDDYAVMKFAGHKSIRMTERYMKWNKNLAIRAVSQVDLFKLKNILHTGTNE